MSPEFDPHLVSPEISTPKIKAIIYDCDGLLIDGTDELWYQSGLRTAEFYGVDFPRETFFGAPKLSSTIARLAGQPISQVREMFYGHMDRFMEKHGIVPMPGAVEIVKSFSPRFSQAVASSSPGRFLDMVIPNMGLVGCFDAIVGGDQVARGKPEPDIFLAAARRLGVQASECLVFEDQARGIEAARRAGMFAVAVNRDQDLGAFDGVDLQLTTMEQFNDRHITAIPQARLLRKY